MPAADQDASEQSMIAPMEARLVDTLPVDPGWQFEPKWDGFRCLAFRSGDAVRLFAKSGKPLHRYFPEVVEMVRALPANDFVLDGELAIPVGAASVHLRAAGACSSARKAGQRDRRGLSG